MRRPVSRTRWSIVVGALLLVMPISCRHVTHAPRMTATIAVHERGDEKDAPLDRRVEIVVTTRAPAGVLRVVDRDGRAISALVPLVAGVDGLRAVVPRRALEPYAGRAIAIAIVGSAKRVKELEGQANVSISTTPPSGTIVVRAPFDATDIGVPFDDAAVREAEALLDVDPSESLRSIDALRGNAPPSERARVDAIGAEAAFAYGRTQLALQTARRGLESFAVEHPPDPLLEARLSRVAALATTEGSMTKEPPPERARLRASESRRSEPIESARDAVLDLRLAELFDRSSPAAPTAPIAARRALEAVDRLAQGVQGAAGDPSALVPFAGALCRIGRHLEDEALVSRGRALARDGHRSIDEAYCAIKSGDVARSLGRDDDALRAYDAARAMLGERMLPREQREAWYSAALAEQAVGRLDRALGDALVACRWIDRLLHLESDLAAREALIANTIGYYTAAAEIALLEGEMRRSIAASEAGKGRALGAILSGDVEASTLGSWLDVRDATEADDPSRVEAWAQSLGPHDVVLTYAQVSSKNGQRRHAVGIVTRDRVDVRVVSDVDTKLFDEIVAHGDAIARNDLEATRTHGALLYDLLLRPIEDALVDKTRIFVSPSRRLQALSWGALFDGTHWLVQRAAVARVPPLGTLTHRASDDAVRLRALRWTVAFDARHPGFEPLPGLAAMGDAFGDAVPAVVRLQGASLTAPRLLDALHRSDAVLYAGHAEYRPDAPLQSALLVTPRTYDDGRVPAWRVASLDRPLDVVLLVGCETSRLWKGTTTFSDDVLGLPRAFLAAGAGHVVGALWPVVDRDAEDFVRALLAVPDDADVVRTIARAQSCLADGTCSGRGVVAWASWVVDAR